MDGPDGIKAEVFVPPASCFFGKSIPKNMAFKSLENETKDTRPNKERNYHLPLGIYNNEWNSTNIHESNINDIELENRI